MIADTIDYGAYIGKLRAFGPPEVVALADFAGNASVVEDAILFWERVEAVSFQLVTDATVASRIPRLSWFAGETVPFAQAVTGVVVPGASTVQVTFAVDTQAGGVVGTGALVVPIPGLWLLPRYTLQVDVAAGVAGDALTGVRLTRQRYQLVHLHDRGLDPKE